MTEFGARGERRERLGAECLTEVEVVIQEDVPVVGCGFLGVLEVESWCL